MAPRPLHLSAAQHKTLARLFTCLVNEKLLKACVVDGKYVESVGIGKWDEEWIVVSTWKPTEGMDLHGSFWMPLRSTPILWKPAGNVAFLDPEDLKPPVKQVTDVEEDGKRFIFADVREVRLVTTQLMEWYPSLKAEMMEQITLEMEDSVANQAAAFEKWYGSGTCRSIPSLDKCEAVDWEQSIVEGHAIHPMSMARFAVPPTLPIISPHKILSKPSLHFFAVPRSEVTIRGDFDLLLSPLLKKTRQFFNPDADVVVPVHQVQIPNILQNFPFARHLPFTYHARAQSSLRTLLVKNLPEFELKLPIGVKISSALRTISPWSTHIGPTFDPVARKVIKDKELLILCREVASVVSNNPDPDIAKHLSCIIRENPQHLVEEKGERVVVCAALTERIRIDWPDEFVVCAVFRLDTADKKARFFERYSRLFLQAFVPPLLHGFCFEAHLQNVLARIVRSPESGDWEIVGFLVRDLGGIKVHQETLLRTAGAELDVWNPAESSQIAHDLHEVHKVAYHTMIVCHLHRFARALGVHRNGVGWQVIRDELHSLLPSDCETRRLWLESSTAYWKAFIKMKLQGLYRDYIYTEVPNLITYMYSS